MDNIERELMKSLQAPFPAEDVEWRAQRSGFKGKKPWALVMPYLTNRAIQERLDEVFGVMGWSNEFKLVEGGFLCGIRATMDGIYTTKWDGADLTDIESFKGGLSGSMKRSAVQYGIGRYLYNLETVFADLKSDRSGKFKVKIDGSYFTYDAPKLPHWALPKPTLEDMIVPKKVEEKLPLPNSSIVMSVSPSTKRILKNPEVITELTPLEKQIEEELRETGLTEQAKNRKTLKEITKKPGKDIELKNFTWLPRMPAASIKALEKDGIEPTPLEKQIAETVADNILTVRAKNCKTLEELGEWYTSLPSEEKRQGSAGYKVKEDRKKELQTKHLASEDITPSKKYTLEVLKEMKLPELYKVCEEVDIWVYKNLKKGDLVAKILKQINK